MKKVLLLPLIFIVFACRKDREDKNAPEPIFFAGAVITKYDPVKQLKNAQGQFAGLDFRTEINFEPGVIETLKVSKTANVGKTVVGLSAASVVFVHEDGTVIDGSLNAIAAIGKTFGAPESGEYNTVIKNGQQNRYSIFGVLKTVPKPGKYRMLITELQLFYEEHAVMKSLKFSVADLSWENPYGVFP